MQQSCPLSCIRIISYFFADDILKHKMKKEPASSFLFSKLSFYGATSNELYVVDFLFGSMSSLLFFVFLDQHFSLNFSNLVTVIFHLLKLGDFGDI